MRSSSAYWSRYNDREEERKRVDDDDSIDRSIGASGEGDDDARAREGVGVGVGAYATRRARGFDEAIAVGYVALESRSSSSLFCPFVFPDG